MNLMKRELFVTSSMEQKSRILDLLNGHNIKYYLRTDDNFGGGLYEHRGRSGSYGMDASVRFQYYIFVHKKDYAAAVALLQENHIY